MQYFALSVSNRQASYEFLSRGLNLQRLSNIAQNPFKAFTTGTSIHHRGYNQFLLEAAIAHYTKYPQIVSMHRKADFSSIPIPPQAAHERYPVAVSSETALTLDEVKKHNLTKHIAIPDHPHIYLTAPITINEAIVLYKALHRKDRKLKDTGFIRGESISMRNVQRLNRFVKLFYASARFMIKHRDEKKEYAAQVVEQVKLVETSDPNMAFTFSKDEDEFYVTKKYASDSNVDVGKHYDVIKPSKKEPGLFMTPRQVQGSISGHLFGFFEGCMPVDFSAALRFLHPQAEHLLGDSYRSAHDAWEDLCEFSRAVSAHPIAQVIAHQSLAIDLAESLGREAFLISDGGQYLGAIVSTSSSLFYESNDVAPITGTELLDEVAKLATLESAKKSMVDYFNARSFRIDGMVGPAIDISAISTLESFLRLLEERIPIKSIDEIGNDVRNALARLSLHYSKGTTPPTIEAISRVVNAVINDDGYPEATHLDPLILLELDVKRVAWLSVFGATRSISFRNLGGSRKNLFQDPKHDPEPVKKEIPIVEPKAKGQGRKKQEKAEKKFEVVSVPFWNRVVVTRPELSLALKDWALLVDSHYLLQVDTAKASQSYLIYEGVEAKTLIDSLRPLGFPTAEVKEKKEFKDKEEPGRKANDDDEESDLEFD